MIVLEFKNRMPSNFFLRILIALPIISIAYIGLNYSGFCFAKMRYISTKEKIRWTFNRLNNTSALRVNIPGKGFEDREFIKYASFNEYIKEHPDCCTFYPSGGSPELPPPTWIQRILGYHSGTFVRIYYKVRYLDDSGKQKSQIIKVDSALRNCGDTVTYY